MNKSKSSATNQDSPHATPPLAEAPPADSKSAAVKPVATKSASVPASKTTVSKPVAPAARKAKVKHTGNGKAGEAQLASTTEAQAKAANPPAPVKGKSKPVAKVAPPAVSTPPAKAGATKEGKDKKHIAKKPKLVRDSFTFPEADYAQIGVLKQRALKAGHEIKKSELLRAGLMALTAMSDAALLKALAGIDKLKPGRPAK